MSPPFCFIKIILTTVLPSVLSTLFFFLILIASSHHFPIRYSGTHINFGDDGHPRVEHKEAAVMRLVPEDPAVDEGVEAEMGQGQAPRKLSGSAVPQECGLH